MPHVVEPFTNATFSDALDRLRSAHHFLVERAKTAIAAPHADDSRWGASVKRSPVVLRGDDRPELIGKTEERLGEVINIAATLERLVDAIEWFATQLEAGCSILECHPSTSDETNGNDLVIVDNAGHIVVRCEVCDVISQRAGSNGKEKKDIKNLGCSEFVPRDGVARYICTAPEFAAALTSFKGALRSRPYRYRRTDMATRSGTCMLLIEPAEESKV